MAQALTTPNRHHEISLLAAYQAYLQWYDLEHFFRFGKQKLLLDAFQTPEGDHEAAWWQFVHLAYLLLWVARHLATCLPHPWERKLPTMLAKLISPTLVQRDFGQIIRQLGTPAQPPKARGYSLGWPVGRKNVNLRTTSRNKRPFVPSTSSTSHINSAK